MTGFDVKAALNGLAALMATIPELQSVNIGAPESQATLVEGWVMAGDPEEIKAAASGGLYELSFNLIAWFSYSVDREETEAERTLSDFVTELTRRIIRNRLVTVDGVTVHLNGSVDRMELPRAAAGGSGFVTLAGQEKRVYPLGICVYQRETITS